MSLIPGASLASWALAWSHAMLRASWQGGLLIAAVWGLCRLSPRLPASLRCGLWWLACLKLLVGLIWAAPVSLPLLPAPSLTSPTSLHPDTQRALTAISASPAHVAASIHDREGESRRGEGEKGRWGVIENPKSKIENRKSDSSFNLHPSSLLLMLWLAGVLARGIVLISQPLMLYWLVRQAHPVSHAEIGQRAMKIAAALRMGRLPQILLCSRIASPIMSGLLRPVVLLPRSDMARLSQQELSAVLAHEFAHVRRCDLWLGIVPVLAQTLFFFHPLVWLACREFEMAREEACDAEAIRITATPPDAYGRLLLKLCSVDRRIGAALGIESNYRILKRRLAMLHHISLLPTRRRWIGIGLPVMIIVFGVVPWRIIAARPLASIGISHSRKTEGEKERRGEGETNAIALGQPQCASYPHELPVVILSRSVSPCSARPTPILAVNRISCNPACPVESSRGEGEKGSGGEKTIPSVQPLLLITRWDTSRGSDYSIPVSPSPLLPFFPSRRNSNPRESGESENIVPVSPSPLLPFSPAVSHRAVQDFTLPREEARSLHVSLPLGSIAVTGEGDRIQVHAETEVKAADEATVQKVLEQLKLNARHEGDTWIVDTAPGHGFNLNGGAVNNRVTIRMPRDMQLAARTSLGSVDAQGVDEVQLHSSSGSIGAHDIRGDVEADTSLGSIKIEHCSGPVNARTSSGNISVEQARGSVIARSSLGSLAIRECNGDVDASTSSGSITIRQALGAVKARTSLGGIDAEITALHPGARVDLTTSTGSISLRLPRDASAHVDATTSVGHIEIAPDLQTHLFRMNAARTIGDHVTGSLGSGASEIRLTNSTGSIKIGN